MDTDVCGIVTKIYVKMGYRYMWKCDVDICEKWDVIY